MELAGFLNVIQSWGPSAISSALVFVVLYLVKKIDTNSKSDERRAAELRDYINKALNGFSERITLIEKEYLKTELFYRELSGWKNEINRLSDLLSNYFMTFNQNIIQLFNQGKK